jgi:membrane protein YqaA with SNARE-associated domain
VGLNAVALLWGFAEATLFFIVPDVWLSVVAVWRGRRAALLAAAWTVGGAVAGGALMHIWGASSPDAAVAALDRLPAISPAMIAGVHADLERQGVAAVVLGSLTGVPYKIYAVQAQGAGFSLPLFLLISAPARAVRFVVVVLVADRLNELLARRLTLRGRYGVLGIVWFALYGLYFAVMPN